MLDLRNAWKIESLAGQSEVKPGRKKKSRKVLEGNKNWIVAVVDGLVSPQMSVLVPGSCEYIFFM